MVGTRYNRLGAVVLVLVVVCSVVAGVAGPGLAHEKGDHVTRNGDTLRIVVADSHFDTDDRNVTVRVKDVKTERLQPTKQNNNTTVYTVPVENLSASNTDLKNATVTVKGENGTLFTERENLRVLSLGNGSKATLDSRTLRVPVKTALGYEKGASVDVALDGNDEAVSGMVRYADGNPYLAVTISPEKLSFPLLKQATVRVSERGQQVGAATVPLRKLAKRATDVVRPTDESVVVTNPLLRANSTYSLVIRTEQPAGRFAATQQTNGSAALEVTDRALAAAKTLTVSVYRDGNPVVAKYRSTTSTETPLSASVTAKGTLVNLTGTAVSAKNVTVWLANGTQYVRTSASVTNGTVDLSATEYRLHPNGSYLVVLTGDLTARAKISGTDNATNTLFYAPPTTNESGGSANGTTQGGPNENDDSEKSGGLGPLKLGAIAALGILVVVGLVVGVKMRGGSSGGARGRSGDTFDLTVVVKDGGTGNRLDAEATVTAKSQGTSGQEQSETITSGKGTLTLPRGQWFVTVESEGASDRERVKLVGGNATQTFELGPKQVTTAVSDDEMDPVSNVPVTCTTDDGTHETRKTNQQGEVSIAVPLGTDEAEVSADHDKYDGDAATVQFDGDTTARTGLTMRRLTGDLQVTATIDDTPVSGLEVGVTPREQAVRELGEDDRTARTDANGVVTFEDVLVGKYEIDTAIPDAGDAFVTASKRVRIRDGTTTRESLDATFEYRLDRADRERIDAIRDDVEALASASGRDVAIPRYYGTVVTDLVETVERLPNEGHRFAGVAAGPDEVVAALLDAAEETVGLVDDSMTTKRNIDLFGACVDMPDHRVEWADGFDLDVLFELLGEDRKTQRQTVLQQLRSVDDRIDDERADLAVVAPARELWERTQEFVTSERGDDPVRGAAVAFVAGGVLNAVDELFDHDELRDRLERTVF